MVDRGARRARDADDNDDDGYRPLLHRRVPPALRLAAPAPRLTRRLWCHPRAPSAVSTIPAVSAFGITAALSVFFNYVLVCTFLPAVVVWYHYHLEKTFPGKCCGVVPAPCCRAKETKAGEVAAERPVVAFLRTKATPFLAWRTMR